MGDIADYYRGQELDDMFEPEKDLEKHFQSTHHQPKIDYSSIIMERYLADELVWITKSGERLNVLQMTKSHVENTKKMLERSIDKNNSKYRAWIKVLTHRLNHM